MKAEEARKESILSCSDEINSVQREIEAAAKKGDLCINYNSIRPGTKLWLSDHGYKIESFNYTNYATFMISW